MTTADDFHCFRTDSPSRWLGIAGVLDADPAAWDWALANIERWLAHGRLHPAPLREWRQWLLDSRHDAGRREALLHALRHPPVDAHQDQLRSCSPFVGGPFHLSRPATALTS